MSSALYRLIRSAIENKQQVVATYDGYLREMCPHAIGLGPSGNEQALFFQFAGSSSRGDVSSLPDAAKWRCLALDRLNEAVARDGEWHTAANYSAPSTCIKQLDLEVDH